MKKLIILSVIFATLLIACSGSDTYRGSWKGMNQIGEKFELTFDAKNLTITDSTGKASSNEYAQHSVNITNGVATYGIRIKDGTGYQIHFPKANNKNIGLIKDENGNPMFTIGRTEYVKYEDIYKLN